jgi:cytochrome c oxidase subunit 3
MDIFAESNLEGAHTKLVLTGLKLGFILFIVSEILFFFSFF